MNHLNTKTPEGIIENSDYVVYSIETLIDKDVLDEMVGIFFIINNTEMAKQFESLPYDATIALASEVGDMLR